MILSDPRARRARLQLLPHLTPGGARGRQEAAEPMAKWWASHGFTMNFQGKDMEIAEDKVVFWMILADFVIHGTIFGLAKCG